MAWTSVLMLLWPGRASLETPNPLQIRTTAEQPIDTHCLLCMTPLATKAKQGKPAPKKGKK